MGWPGLRFSPALSHRQVFTPRRKEGGSYTPRELRWRRSLCGDAERTLSMGSLHQSLCPPLCHHPSGALRGHSTGVSVPWLGWRWPWGGWWVGRVVAAWSCAAGSSERCWWPAAAWHSTPRGFITTRNNRFGRTPGKPQGPFSPCPSGGVKQTVCSGSSCRCGGLAEPSPDLLHRTTHLFFLTLTLFLRALQQHSHISGQAGCSQALDHIAGDT